MTDPWLAFSGDVYGDSAIAGVSEGLIFPEKEEGASLLRAPCFSSSWNRSHQLKEMFSESQVSKEPVFIRVLVGTKEGMERWARFAGPACCTLWVEVARENFYVEESDMASGSGALISGELKLAYRLRSSHLHFLHVLKEAVLVLCPFFRKGKPGSRSRVQASDRASVEPLGDWMGLREREKQRLDLTNSITSARGSGKEQIGSQKTISRWLLVMPIISFRQLLCMIECGGVLSEFQCLLTQLVDIPFFLDVNFHFVDFSYWLNRYPYVVVLNGFDLLVSKKGVNWTCLRFDFCEGQMKVKKGEGMHSMLKVASLETVLWEAWEDLPMWKDAQRIGPLGAILFDKFYLDGKGFIGDAAVQKSLDCTVERWKEVIRKLRHLYCISGATVYELKAVDIFEELQVSTKEQCALYQLQSLQTEVKHRGLRILIEWLLGGITEDINDSPIWLGGEKLRSEHMLYMDKESGSMSDRPLRHFACKWNSYRLCKSERAGFLIGKSNSPAFAIRQEVNWRRLARWLDNGFMEILVEEILKPEHSQNNKKSFDVNRALQACLKVLEILPGEGSYRFKVIFVTCMKEYILFGMNIMGLQGYLRNMHFTNLTRRFRDQIAHPDTKAHDPRNGILTHTAADVEGRSRHENGLDEGNNFARRKMRNFLWNLSHASKVLAVIVSGSSILSSTLVAGEGISIVFDTFIMLNKLFHQETGSKEQGMPQDIISASTLPGEAVPEQHGTLRVSHKQGNISENEKSLQERTKDFPGIVTWKIEQGYTVRDTLPSPLPCTASPVPDLMENCIQSPTPFRDCDASLEGQVAFAKQSDLLYDAKYHLLLSVLSMLSTKSTLIKTEWKKMLDKFSEESKLVLVSCFVEELMGSENLRFCGKFRSCIYHVIFLLDGTTDGDSFLDQREIKNTDQNMKSCTLSQKFSDLILLELRKQLDFLLCVWKLEKRSGDAQSGIGVPFCRRRIKRNCHNDKEVVLGKVDILLQLLVSFVRLHPDQRAIILLFKYLQEQIGHVLDILCVTACTMDQLHIMQNVLYLLQIAVECLKRFPEIQGSQELENILWQLIVENNLHWNCIRRYCEWVAIESCRCIQFPEFFHSKFKRSCSIWSRTAENEDIPLMRLLEFMRAVVILMQRRINVKSISRSKIASMSCSDKMSSIFEFLMNPTSGLLVRLTKGILYKRLKRCQSPFEMSSLGLEYSAKSLCTDRHPSSWCSDCCISVEYHMPNDDMVEFKQGHKWQCAFLKGQSDVARRWQICELSSCLASCEYAHAHKNTKGCPSWPAITAIDQACLHLLADIFNVKFGTEETSFYSKQMFHTSNPFLALKNVESFIDFHVLCFLHLFKKKFSLRELEEPFCVSFAEKGCAFKGHLVCLMHPREDGSEICRICSEISLDHNISNQCVAHVQVLLSLAQNQNQHISRRFKELGTMAVLVRMFAFEYEAFQTPTPKPTSLDQVIQNMGCSNSVVHTETVLLNSSEELSEVELTDKVSQANQEHAPYVTGGTTQNFMQENGASYEGHVFKVPAIQCSELSPHANSSSQTSQATFESSLGSSSIQTPSLAELKRELSEMTLGCGLHSPVWPVHFDTSSKLLKQRDICLLLPKSGIKEVPKLQLGFLSSADIGPFDAGFKMQALGESHRNLAGQNEFKLKWQKIMSNVNLSRPPCVAAEGDNQLCQQGMCVDSNLSEGVYNNANKIVFQASESQQDRRVSFHDDSGVNDTSAKKYSVFGSDPKTGTPRYSGRFFDLNEEVERELAEEEEEEDEEEEEEEEEKEDTRQEEMNGHVPLDTDELKYNQENVTNQKNLPCLGFKKGAIVPRLNLPKSARKGEQGGHEITQEMKSAEESTKINENNYENEKIGGFHSADVSNNTGFAMPCEYERLKNRVYRNGSLHLILLELYISLMLTPQGTLEECYSDRFQSGSQKLNAPFFLSYHILSDLNHAANWHLIPSLSKRMKDFHPSAFRILKLSWRALFKPSIYKNRVRIAHGAFAQIYTANVCQENSEEGQSLVVLKIVEIPKGPHDPCKFFDIFTEVQILEKFSGEPRVCQLLDYGVDSENFILVLKHYKCSLRTWRQKHLNTSRNLSAENVQVIKPMQTFIERLPLYLEIYAAVLDAVKILEVHNVVHYDLKCDNILLEPISPTLPEEEFWDPVWPPLEASCTLPFKVSIADFGQSKASILQGGECTFRSRGTEYVKSPEMLKLLSSKASSCSISKTDIFDESVGKAVDVWGLGCLLYELLTGEYLLYDDDWMRFFIRVTLPTEELITEEKAAKLGNFKPVMDLIRFVLVRDPQQRPKLDDVLSRLRQLQKSLNRQDQKLQHVFPRIIEEESLPDIYQNLERVSGSGSACLKAQISQPSTRDKSNVSGSWFCCSLWCCQTNE